MDIVRSSLWTGVTEMKEINLLDKFENFPYILNTFETRRS